MIFPTVPTLAELQANIRDHLLQTQITEFVRLLKTYGAVEVFAHDGYVTLTPMNKNGRIRTADVSTFPRKDV